MYVLFEAETELAHPPVLVQKSAFGKAHTKQNVLLDEQGERVDEMLDFPIPLE